MVELRLIEAGCLGRTQLLSAVVADTQIARWIPARLAKPSHSHRSIVQSEDKQSKARQWHMHGWTDRPRETSYARRLIDVTQVRTAGEQIVMGLPLHDVDVPLVSAAGWQARLDSATPFISIVSRSQNLCLALTLYPFVPSV